MTKVDSTEDSGSPCANGAHSQVKKNNDGFLSSRFFSLQRCVSSGHFDKIYNFSVNSLFFSDYICVG